jgi:hypothetical protein
VPTSISPHGAEPETSARAQLRRGLSIVASGGAKTKGAQSPQATRRLLLVSYHFGESSTGGMRWAAMLPYLRAAGWGADVITASPISPEERQGWTQRGVSVITVEPIRWLERAGSAALGAVHSVRVRLTGNGPSKDPRSVSDDELRRNVDAIPIHRPDFELGLWSAAGRTGQDGILATSHLYWSLRAARKGSRLWDRRHHDVIVVSTPPHWTQLAGHLIAKDRGAPLVLDLRDPWDVGVTEMHAYEPGVVRAVTERVEVGMQRKATVVIHNTRMALDRALAFTPPHTNVPRVVIPNGYDDPPPLDVKMDPSTFRILFSGWLYPFMDPRPLLEATAALAARHELSPEQLRIQFLGSPDAIGDVPLRDVIRAFGLAGHADLLPRLNRERALEMQAQAAVLVAFDYPHPLSVVMKAYDYLQMPGALLFLANPGSSLAELAETVGSKAVAPRDTSGILCALEEALASWQQGVSRGPHDREGTYHRSRAAGATLRLLEGLAEAR